MPTSSPVTVARAIVHKVDHKLHDAPALADLETPLDPEVAAYLGDIIFTNSQHKSCRSATFSTSHSDPIEGLFNQCLEQDQCFISASREIAERLFDAVKPNPNISPSDLVIATYRDNSKGPRLALLKMDPTIGFVTSIESDSQGRIRYRLQRVDDILPQGSLQKCAFIFPQPERSKTRHLSVLDHQTQRHGYNRLVSSFFSKDFLNAQIGLNDADQTRTFVLRGDAWLQSQGVHWSDEDRNRFIRQLNNSLDADTLDVAGFAASVIPDQEQQESFLSHMRDRGIHDLVFRPDPVVRQRFQQRRIFRGDHDLRISISAEGASRPDTFHESHDESTGLYTITITTSKWVEVPR